MGQLTSSQVINYRELRAVGEALVAFQEDIRGREVQVSSDNSTVVAYLGHQGGTRSSPLLELSKEILEWAEGRVLSISAIHIKGTSNIEADFLSRRQLRQEEWELNPEVFQTLVQYFGNPEIDLFANRQNRKVERYFSIS